MAAVAAGAVAAAALVAGGVLYALGDDGDDGGRPAAAGSSAASATGTPSAPPSSPAAGPSGTEDPGRGAPLGGGPGDGSDEPDASSSPTDSGTDSSAPAVPYVALEPGQCFDHPGLDSTVTRVEIRSCDGPHDGEVIANETLTGTFGTEQEIQQKALGLCRADAEKRLADLPRDKTFYYYALYPSRETYARGQDRVSCSLTLSASVDGPKLQEPLPG
ncbi:hypothetical protein IHE55_05900 [Streptomyces pactum]|uniref:Septum formation-related domain-containing protein n=1 Tax=Streptomyces pactum TaxID=68249 RepID=A0ABS0NGN3_9ACTN|nr:septum formation family protein [Streptomyces pactum]MBH5334358.1 hypothetical protein [Streptomyces pactum]